MAQFVVFEAGDDRIFAAHDARAGRHMRVTPSGASNRKACDRDGRKIRRNVLANFFEIRLFERFDARGDGLVVRMKTGTLYLRAMFTASIAV
jgi:hypothetical protein